MCVCVTCIVRTDFSFWLFRTHFLFCFLFLIHSEKLCLNVESFFHNSSPDEESSWSPYREQCEYNMYPIVNFRSCSCHARKSKRVGQGAEYHGARLHQQQAVAGWAALWVPSSLKDWSVQYGCYREAAKNGLSVVSHSFVSLFLLSHHWLPTSIIPLPPSRYEKERENRAKVWRTVVWETRILETLWSTTILSSSLGLPQSPLPFELYGAGGGAVKMGGQRRVLPANPLTEEIASSWHHRKQALTVWGNRA